MLSRRAFGLMTAASALAGAPPLSAQEALSEPELFQWGHLYLPYYLSAQAAAESGDWSAVQEFAQQAAMVGDEAGATSQRFPRQTIPAELELRGEPAIAAIVERARDARVVILNEAHHISGHRAFAEQVLRALRPLGFDVFAAETFSWDDLSPAKVQGLRPGAPFLHQHGYYSRDPVYAEAVRAALALGYRLAGYEITDAQSLLPADAPPADSINEREEAQARNLIANVLDPDPQARVVVLCGLSHVTEAPMGATEWFASRLKRLAGLDPLTIEQSANWPAFDPDLDRATTRAVLERLSPTEPVAVFEPSGRPFAVDGYADRVDLSVYHPRFAPVDGRAGWLAADPTRRATPVRFPAQSELSLIQAVSRDEGMGAVPSDHCLVEPGRETAVLHLRPADYLIRLETLAGWRGVGTLRVERELGG